MSFENYVVRAKCFIPSSTSWTRESLSALNRRIANVMEKRGYVPDNVDPRDLLFGQLSALTMSFTTSMHVPKRSRIRSLTKSEAEAHQEGYFKALRKLVDSHPFNLVFTISFRDPKDGSKAFIIGIESEPSVVAKIRQLNMKEEQIDDTKYQNIIWQNKRDVGEIIHSLGASLSEGPEVIRARVRSVQRPLIDTSLIGTMPSEVAACLKEANSCFASNAALACSVMLRKSIEVAVTKKFLQEGRDDRVYDAEGHEFGLGKKLDALSEVAPRPGKHIDEIERVKWLGDASAHGSKTQITPADLQAVVPLVSTFLAELELKR